MSVTKLHGEGMSSAGHVHCFHCGDDGLRNEHYYVFDGKVLCSMRCLDSYRIEKEREHCTRFFKKTLQKPAQSLPPPKRDHIVRTLRRRDEDTFAGSPQSVPGELSW